MTGLSGVQAASSALFSTRSTPVWTMRGVYRVIDKMQHKHFQKCLADIDFRSSCFD